MLHVIEHSERSGHQKFVASAPPRAVSLETTERPLDVGLTDMGSPHRNSVSNNGVDVLPVPLNDRRNDSTTKEPSCFLADSADAERSAATSQDPVEQKDLQLHYGHIAVEIRDGNDRCTALL